MYLPDEKLVWLKADIIFGLQDISDFEIEITDPDHDSSIVPMSLQFIDTLPMQNENMSATGVDDMSLLDFLHEASILDNLRMRFNMEQPYTYTGDIVIAVS